MNFGKFYTGFCFTMGLYGYTRGFRSTSSYDKSPRLTTQKLSMGFFNALLYSAPVYNLWPLARLVDRLEIDYNGLDKTQYKDAFIELVGECYDTI
jgi:hypothetical protein